MIGFKANIRLLRGSYKYFGFISNLPGLSQNTLHLCTSDQAVANTDMRATVGNGEWHLLSFTTAATLVHIQVIANSI